MADKKLNEVTANATVDYVIGTLNDGSTVRISKADLAAVVGELLPVASDSQKGLMPAGNFTKLGDLFGKDGKSVRDGSGYGYGTTNGSGVVGPFLSFTCGISVLQIQANQTGESIKFRTKNAAGNWTSWKTFNIS